MINAEHAINLADIAREAEYVVAVAREAGPLRRILLRRLPDEGIAHWRIGRRDIAFDDPRRRLADVETGDAVEDHRHGVRAADAPAGRRQSLAHQGVIGPEPELDFVAQRLARILAGRADRLCEIV